MAKKKKKSTKLSEFIQETRERFKESYDAENSNRELMIRDANYENSVQWEDDEKAQRKGRPCITINKLSGNVKQIDGDARQNRPRIKVRPTDSTSDPLTAELLTGLIRNIENVSDAESAYDTGRGCSIRSGLGYWRIITDYADDDVFDQEIRLERIVNQFSVYYDQSSIRADYTDADYCFVVEEMTREKAQKKYPKADLAEWEKGTGEANSGWFSKDTVRIAEYFWKEPYTKHIYEVIINGKAQVIEIDKPKEEIIPDDVTGEPLPHVIDDGPGAEDSRPMRFKRKRAIECHKIMYCKMSGNEILEKQKEWPGKYFPIIPILGDEVWIEGERILRSAIRFAIEPQKLYNWARSNNMETMALAPKQPWILTAEQIKGYEKYWDSAYTTPRPYLLYNHVPGQAPPKRLLGSVGDQGANQEAMLASDDIKATTGIYDASLGARGNETSGKAINARQRQGDTATFIFPDNEARAIKHTGMVLVDLISKIYDGERVVRLMGDDLNKQFPQIPMANGQQLIQINDKGTEAWAKINFKDPMTGKIYNDLTVGKYDIVIDAGPGYDTKRQEATDGMIMLGQAAPHVLPVLVPRIAKNQDWPEAQEIGDEIKQMMQPQGPSPKDQIDIQKGQIELKGKELDLVKKGQEIQQGQANEAQQMYQIAQQAVADLLRQIGLVR